MNPFEHPFFALMAPVEDTKGCGPVYMAYVAHSRFTGFW